MRYAIFGAGGHGRVVLDCLRSQDAEVVGFLDDDLARVGQVLDGVPVLGALEQAMQRLRLEDVTVVPAVGNNAIRLRLVAMLAEAGLRLGNAVHRSAVVSPGATLGEGCVLMPLSCVNTGSALGRGCIVNTGATVDHDCVLADGVHVAPGVHVAGLVEIGEGTLLGVGTAVRPGIRIGAWCVIGAGAAVVKDIPDRAVACGVPATVRSGAGCAP